MSYERGRSAAMVAALMGMAMMGEHAPVEDDSRTNASPNRGDRTPEQSQERISARQARMARKLARRAERAAAEKKGADRG